MKVSRLISRNSFFPSFSSWIPNKIIFQIVSSFFSIHFPFSHFKLFPSFPNNGMTRFSERQILIYVGYLHHLRCIVSNFLLFSSPSLFLICRFDCCNRTHFDSFSSGVGVKKKLEHFGFFLLASVVYVLSFVLYLSILSIVIVVVVVGWWVFITFHEIDLCICEGGCFSACNWILNGCNIAYRIIGQWSCCVWGTCG